MDYENSRSDMHRTAKLIAVLSIAISGIARA
jgi:hypothetical protein